MTNKSSLKLVLLCVVAGIVGMALFQASVTVYQDWAFLHRARLVQEYQQQQQQQQQARPAPAPAPAQK